MIKYWPNQQSINLNNAIVDLFFSTEKKLRLKQNNISNQYLYIDILNNTSKNKLLKVILSEFKQLILDLVELNLNKNNLTKLNKKIWKIFISRVCKKFLLTLKSKNINTTITLDNDYNQLIEYLLIYLTLGSSKIDNNIFLFEPTYTPYNHVQILFENFIIQISNIIMKKLVNNLNNSYNISNFLRTQKICNKLYTSNRSTVLFFNNLRWQNFIYSYIYEIKSLYNERQQVWLISKIGIVTKYIYFSKINKIKKFNQLNTIFILWLELKDIIIPKIERLIIQIAKYVLFCSINLFSNIILILIRIIVFYLNK
uniref:Uncharacterized protein n=1 Tax=Thaumatella adunca TaxID=2006976 RepID=A0A1Z1MNM1_9FLOR|nr:hypothetical protein [Thaumatella adunca]ARW67354.1 hypothetical protein [Thaumatella adunca]